MTGVWAGVSASRESGPLSSQHSALSSDLSDGTRQQAKGLVEVPVVLWAGPVPIVQVPGEIPRPSPG